MSIERFSLDGKVAVITGGAGGCGAEYGRGLAAAGAAVVLADLDGERAEAHAQELRAQGRQAVGVRVDITDPDAAEAMVQRTRDEFGGVDILINNAALMKEIPMGSLLTLPLDWWDRVMEVNVKGALVCTRAAVPSMLERGGGRIINQVSGGAFTPGGIYSISKLALVSITAVARQRAGAPGHQRERDRARVRGDEAGYESLGQGQPHPRRDPRRGPGQEGRSARRPRRHRAPAGVERRRLDQRADDQRRRRLDHEGLNR